MPRLFVATLCTLLIPVTGLAQDHVVSNPTDSRIPELRGNRPTPDRDLAIALRLFNGQNSLNNRDRSVGVVERVLPVGLRARIRSTSLIAEGVVLRTDAYLAPDLNGMVTVVTVLPSAILAMPGNYPPGTQTAPRPAPRRGVIAPPPPPRYTGNTLRFVLAGGTVYFDDNNGARVRQSGVRYPVPGESLIFFGETITDASQNPSAVLMLTGACSLQGQQCSSIDGSATTSDALATYVPGGLAATQAFSLSGAAIADPNREGVRGLAASVEDRYNLGIGDLRQQDGPEILMPPFAPVTADESMVRAHILQSDAALTTGGLGVITHSVVSIDRIWSGSVPKQRTMEVTQRGGLLWKDGNIILSALFPAQYPLADSGDYFLTVGRTSDNRWEVRSAWRVIGDRVFPLDHPRTQLVLRDGTSYSMSTDAFLKTLGLQ